MRIDDHYLTGRRVEIKAAYNSLTGARDIWDEIAGCEATVLCVYDDRTVDVVIKGGDETNTGIERLRVLGDEL